MPKNLLITGINGFIGSWCKKYFEEDYTIFGIDSNGETSQTFIQGKVTKENLEKLQVKFDIIIHLAGTSTVGQADQNPEKEYQKTVACAKELIEFILGNNKDAKLIFISSASVYGNNYTSPIKEDNQLHPISTYGKHKLEVENLCKQYESEGLNYSIIRLFSVYGEGLKKQLLWDFSKRLYENFQNSSLNCFGTGNETRDYIHIEDVVRLIETVIHNPNAPTIINGGTGIQTSVDEVLLLLKKEHHYTGELIYDNIDRKGNPQSLIADITKMKALNFTPQISLAKGLKRYVAWFSENS